MPTMLARSSSWIPMSRNTPRPWLSHRPARQRQRPLESPGRLTLQVVGGGPVSRATTDRQLLLS
ncbi:hypothetical protein BCD48_30155 [Pseudofrankia sp. BMG5.36]|nr:hypothetical protein BCD48_30155 [Pseudofrankia sp. BMG5.36]